MNSKEQLEQTYTSVAHDAFDKRHHGAISIPVYQNSLFTFETHEQFENAMQDTQSHHVYSRGNNPTVQYLEHKLAELECAESAKCFASGMSAITSAIMSLVQQGDHIVCVHQVYGPTREFLGQYLTRFGIETTFVDGSSMEDITAAIRPNTKLLYLESPTTMLFELQDLIACAELARRKGVVTIIDNTWASPIYQNPITLGIDLVVHSISKYMSGHSDCLGGVIIGSRQLMDRISHNEYMLFGGIMTPQTAALVIRGLRTLPLRLERHQSSGLIIAEYMSKQSYVSKVNHPGLASHKQHELALRQMVGFGSLFSFESKESFDYLRNWVNHLQLFKIGVSWGGFESLVTLNRINKGQTEEALHVIRLYIGMESPKDLIGDLDHAWKSVEELKSSGSLI